MGLSSGGRPATIDLLGIVVVSFLGYIFAKWTGAILAGLTLSFIYGVLEFYLIRPKERLEDWEDELTIEE